MAINKNAILVLFLSVVVLMALPSCSLRALHEAQAVVSQADSLRHEGQMFRDSAALAEYYTTLTKWQRFYPDDYARCCYHYGRLLREKDDPVAAMQVFINATHSHTDDLHILGRVYSNMGDICHHAEDFSLSRDMFEKSANMFLSNGDTLLYYYGQNNIGFEEASLGHMDSCRSIFTKLKPILAKDSTLRAYSYCTYAEAHILCKQYDSAIHFANLALSLDYSLITAEIQLAQSYSFLGIKDSAVYYAEQVLMQSANLSEKQNALYILTNDDENKDITSIRKTAADRSDIQKLIEICRSNSAQAAQLLEQDMQRRPNITWVYATLITMFILCASGYAYVLKKRKRHNLLSQKIDDLQHKSEATIAQMQKQIEVRSTIILKSTNIKSDLCWNDFEKMCDVANQNFFFIVRKLQQSYNLSEREIRLCVLILIGISSSKQLADLLYYAESGIRNFKNRTAKKLDANSTNLRDKLINIAIK